MNRPIGIVYAGGLVGMVVLVLLTGVSLFRDILPSERPVIVTVNEVIALLAMLTLAAGFGHVLDTRRISVDPRFLTGFLVLAAMRLLIEFVVR